MEFRRDDARCAPRQVREWVEHHARLGIGKFYITDTGSAEPLGRQIRDHIASGLVDYFYRCAWAMGRLQGAAGEAWTLKEADAALVDKLWLPASAAC